MSNSVNLCNSTHMQWLGKSPDIWVEYEETKILLCSLLFKTGCILKD